MLSKRVLKLSLYTIVFLGVIKIGASMAQDAKKDAPTAVAAAPDAAAADAPKKEDAKPTATDAPKAATPEAAKAPELPAYYPGSDPKKWPDPTGSNAGTVTQPALDPAVDKDGKPTGEMAGDDPSKLKQGDLLDRINHNFYSINMVWTLIAGFLVMFMQAGFALVETGLCRAKNAAHTMAMNFMIYALGCTAFYAYGFAIGWGNWNSGAVPPGYVATLGPGLKQLSSGVGIEAETTTTKDDKGVDVTSPTGGYKWNLMGTKGFFLKDCDDVSIMALFFFMMVFFDTTATIPTGVLCERWAWKNFLLYGLWVAFPYCLYGGWVWGGGWLAQLGVRWGWGHGAVDFAGSGVVHAMGGVIGLAGGIIIGPRIGKYKDGKPQPIPGHHIPMVILGTFILAFGWFGFNPGSTLAGADLRISVVVVNTMLASIAAALSCHLTMSLKGLKPDPSMLCNGMLAGLVAITAPCAFVDSWAAFAIGAIAGSLVVFSVFFWEKMGIDDVVGAISVHGVNGLWGVISLGIFANGKYGAGFNGVTFNTKNASVVDDSLNGVRGCMYGDWGQLYAQLMSCLVVCITGFVISFILFKISNLITPIRVSKEIEIEGLDGPEMGAHGYPDFTISKS